ncbi:MULTISPECIES: RNA polymerase factor sigma-54 [unclassified Lysinibacillus]|uniref:RNA polymerase factor sigma-54 n=1 Tax=unclassified Lysinibacillus TaxID=2636778 RepID=UPI0038264D18
MDPSLKLQQQQKVMMTPQLQQSIELLQYNAYELEQFLNEQQLENPFIDLQSPAFQERVYSTPHNSSSSMPNEFYTKMAEPNYREELLQLATLTFVGDDLRLTQTVIKHLDNKGYSPLQLGNLSVQQHDRAIQLLQQIGPPGVGARNLQECLLLQIEEKDHDLQQLIQNGLLLLAERKFLALQKSLQLSKEQLSDCINRLQQLTPIPCTMSQENDTLYVTPDIIVFMEDGTLQFSLNDGSLPKVQLNDSYKNIASFLPNSEQKYVKQHFKQYNWLIHSLQQRRQTIIQIMSVVLEHQQAFFVQGLSSLKPLTLQDVATQIDMHVSTVSRAIRNKRIQTPVGTYLWKDLFSSKIDNTQAQHSQTSILEMIKNIITAENKQKPLSDQKIAEILASSYQIHIARRTISKYREELGIQAASKRKEL